MAAAEDARVERTIGDSGRWLEAALYRLPAWPGVPQAAGRDSHENRASALLVLRDVTAARQAREAREAFLGVMSHELRTPITTIYGGAHVLTRELEPERRQVVVADLLAEAERLYRMVEDLLVLSRVERESLVVNLEPVSLQRLVPRIVASERVRWPSHTFVEALPPDLPLVAADETYLEQVLRNLLGNAAKFSPAGSRIEVHARPDQDRIQVAVLDEGPGFTAEETDRLFGLFYRSATAKLVPGSGIGLYVSRRLVEAMGGRLGAAPRTAGGAEFAFTLTPYEG